MQVVQNPVYVQKRANEKSQKGSMHRAPVTWGKKWTPTAFMLNMEDDVGIGA